MGAHLLPLSLAPSNFKSKGKEAASPPGPPLPPIVIPVRHIFTVPGPHQGTPPSCALATTRRASRAPGNHMPHVKAALSVPQRGTFWWQSRSWVIETRFI